MVEEEKVSRRGKWVITRVIHDNGNTMFEIATDQTTPAGVRVLNLQEAVDLLDTLADVLRVDEMPPRWRAALSSWID